MPRRRKGARLWLRQRRHDRQGRVVGEARWFIIDDGRQIGTGCAAHQASEAEQKLAEYIAAKYQPTKRERDIEEIPIADVLILFLEARGDRAANPRKFEERLG